MNRYTDRQREEAAEWFIDIFEADDPSPELVQRWTRWLDAEEGNRLAFKAVEQAWHQVPEDLAFSEAAPAASSRTGRLFRPLAYAAGLAVLAGAGWLIARQDFAAHPSSGEFGTRTGEHMDLTLADGSRVTLGARSRLSVDFTAARRELSLLAGEAFFVVHKDARRPFTVNAMGGEITALGTAFNVRAVGGRVTVAVTDGAVAVNDLPAPLSLGEQVTYSAAGDASVKPEPAIVVRVDPSQPARWRSGWLMYRDEPLRDVIADVERYTDRGIALADSVPADLRFTGAVFKDSVVEWVRALPDAFPLAVRDDGDGTLRVTGVPAGKDIAGFP